MVQPDWFREIHFAFSHKQDGQMSLRRGSPAEVLANRQSFLNAHSLPLSRVVAGELTHGPEVAIVSQAQAGRGAFGDDWIPAVDGLITIDPEVLLLTTHADCAPLILLDRNRGVLGQAHCGWRGMAAGIIERLTRSVLKAGGGYPDSLFAWIGPTVRPCCYAVGAEVAAWFPPDCLCMVADTTRLDLPRFVKLELARMGLRPENVSDSLVCTCCDRDFSSYRRDGAATTAMALVTGLRR